MKTIGQFQRQVIDEKLCDAFAELENYELANLTPLEFHNLVVLESLRLLLRSVNSLDDLKYELEGK